EEEPEKIQRHEVRRQLDLVASIGCIPAHERMQVAVGDEDRLRARAVVAATGIDPKRPWLIVHPGASAASRRYRPEGFVEVVRRLTHEAEVQVMLTGSENETELLEHIRASAGLPRASVVLNLGLGTFAALIAEARVLLSNN